MHERPEHALREIIARFRRGGELGPLVCLVATVASGALVAGLGIAAAYLYGLTRPSLDPTRTVIGWVRGEDILVGLGVAGLLWAALLFFLWRPAVRLRRHSGPLATGVVQGASIRTVAIAGATLILSFVVQGRRWDDVEFGVLAIALLGAGLVLAVWLPVIFLVERGRPVRRADGSVVVTCLHCGYDLRGVRSTTCPECGTTWAIDALIRAQGYAESPAPEEVPDEGSAADAAG